MLCRGCICTIYDRINEVTNHPLLGNRERVKRREYGLSNYNGWNIPDVEYWLPFVDPKDK